MYIYILTCFFFTLREIYCMYNISEVKGGLETMYIYEWNVGYV